MRVCAWISPRFVVVERDDVFRGGVRDGVHGWGNEEELSHQLVENVWYSWRRDGCDDGPLLWSRGDGFSVSRTGGVRGLSIIRDDASAVR